MSQVVTLAVGAQLFYSGDVCEVVGLDGSGATLRNGRTERFSVVSLARLAASARPATPAEDDEEFSCGLALHGLTPAQRAQLSERAGHVREVLSGYRSGQRAMAAVGEPLAEFDPSLPLTSRYQAKADQLGVDVRTVRRWVSSYREAGEAGLVDHRGTQGRGSAVDPRWEEALVLVLAEGVDASTPTRGAVLDRVARLVEQTHGAGVVAIPSTSTAYRRLKKVVKGTNAVAGSAKGRRSIADRPSGVYGRLRATRPGEYVVLDTQDLDVFAMEAVTCRWVGVQLTVAQDLLTRAILGLRVTPVSTKAVDVAGVLYQAMATPPDREPGEGSVLPAEESPVWPYHGVPSHVVFSEGEPVNAVAQCPPETLVVDHGKVFLSAHVISVCTRLGISIQPAQPYKPTDKPTVERFFRTLREGLIQHLPAYKGPDVYSRGDSVEDAAFLYVHELEDIIREWVGVIYHRRKHDGLAVPEWPGLRLSPLEMYGLGVARAGRLRLPARPELVYDFLEVAPRTIQHYGVEANGLRYNGDALDAYRNQESPYAAYGGKWPIRVNPDDVRAVFFQDPEDHRWHRLEWEHAAALGAPFSVEATSYARRLAVRQDRWVDEKKAMTELLARWDAGMVADRRERRMALRLAAERAALPIPDEPAQVAALPSVAALTGVAVSSADRGRSGGGDEHRGAKVPVIGKLPDRNDLADDLDGDDDDAEFYADAFDVLT